MSHSELATSYAALILADDDVDVTVNLPPAPLKPGVLILNLCSPTNFKASSKQQTSRMSSRYGQLFSLRCVNMQILPFVPFEELV